MKKIKKIILILLPKRLLKKIIYRNRFNNVSIGDYCLIDKNSTLKEYSRAAMYSDIKNSIICEYTSIGRNSRVINAQIGKFCSISWNCTIGATMHPYNTITTNAFPYVPEMGKFVNERKQKIVMTTVKNDVWIGCNSVILPGVTIENGAIIGAGAVVTKNVPPYAIVAGVPAKIIGYRFNDEIINRLMNLKWWNCDRTFLEKNINLFQESLDELLLKELENRIKQGDKNANY